MAEKHTIYMRHDGNTVCLALAIAIKVLERLPVERRPMSHARMERLLREVVDQRNANIHLDEAEKLIAEAT